MTSPCSAAFSFPRTRGDGPRSIVIATANGWFPPHARGWTLGRAYAGYFLDVSPARAGMDLKGAGGWVWKNRFPRTRGDGPTDSHSAVRHTAFPPHARGWTVPDSRRSGEFLVSPARRGDGPSRDGHT